MLYPAAFGRLCVETVMEYRRPRRVVPAAFGRLCVETSGINVLSKAKLQPPSGGCVLKLLAFHPLSACRRAQPPSGGCVLKQD